MKTLSTKRVLAFWLAVAMLGGSAPTAFAAEMATLQQASKGESSGAVKVPEVHQDAPVAQPEDTVTPSSVTIDHVSLGKKEVTVQGGSAAVETVNATAHSSAGETENTVNDVTWSIEGSDQTVQIDAHTGVISVPAKAKAGTYTVVATPKSSDSKAVTGKAEATLTVKREAEKPTVSKVFLNDKSGSGKIDVTGKKITIPAGERRALSTTVLNQFDEPYTGKEIVKYEGAGTGIHVEGSTLILEETASDTAIITVKCGDRDSGEKFEVEAVKQAKGDITLKINNLKDQIVYGEKYTPNATVESQSMALETPPTIKYIKVERTASLESVEIAQPTEVGNYRAIASYESKDGEVAYAQQDFAIVPKPLTIRGATATPRSYEADNKTVVVTGMLFGLEVGDSTDDVQLKATGTMEDDSVGENKPVTITATLEGDKAGNYTVTAPTGVTVNITKADYGQKPSVAHSVLKNKQCRFNLPKEIEELDGVTATLATNEFNGKVVKSAAVSGRILTVTTKEDAAGTDTVALKINSKNYNEFPLIYTLKVADREDVSDKIAFADKTVTYDGTEHKLADASLASDVIKGEHPKWTYTWTKVGAKATKEEAAQMPAFREIGVYEVTVTYEDDKNWGQKTARLTIQEKPAVKSTLSIRADQLGKSRDKNHNNFSIRYRDEADGYIRLRADANDYLDKQKINGTYSEWIGLEITPKSQNQTVNVADLYVSMNGSTWSKLSSGTYGDLYLDDVSGNSFHLWYDTDDRDRADNIYLATDGKGANKFQIRVDFDAYSNSASGGSSGSGSSSTNKVDGKKVSTTTVGRTPSVSGNSASVSISSSTLSDALEKNKKEAKHENADKTFIELDVKSSKSVESTTVTVPVNSLNKISKEDTGLSVVTNQGTLQLDHRALSRIASAAGKSEVSITLEEDSKDQYTLMIKDGSSKIIDLGSGDAEISFAYKLKSGERASDVKVYRVGDGSHTWMSTYGGSTVYAGTGTYAAATGNYVTNMGAEYSASKKKVTFSTDALGTFLVTTDNLQTGGSTNTNTNTNTNSSYTTFVDVPSYRWSAQYINKLASLGVINGTGGGYFEPTLYVTREEFVKMLAGVARANVSGYTASYFPDVSPYRWSAPYIAWAVDHGVTAGTDGGKFAPEMKITREEMAAMIYRYTQSAGKALPNKNVPVAFADSNRIDNWAVTAVSVMQQAGIIDGNVVNGRYTFDPKVPATREECAKMLCVLYDLI